MTNMEIKSIRKEERILKDFVSIEMDSIDARDLRIVLGDVIHQLREKEQDEQIDGIESSKVQYNLATLYKLYTPLVVYFHRIASKR